MAEVRLNIGGRTHIVACRDGGETALEALGRTLDAHAATAARAAGGQGGERTMLYIALMLADELSEARATAAAAAAAPPPAPPPPHRQPSDRLATDTLERIADRLERLADGLEKTATNA